MALGFVKKLGLALGVGAVTVFTGGLGGLALSQALKAGAINAGLTLLDRLVRRGPKPPEPTQRGVNAVAAAPARYALGTSRTEGVLTYLRENGADLHLVYAISEGACAGLAGEKKPDGTTEDVHIYVDGNQIRIKPVVGSPNKYEPFHATNRGTIELWAYTAADGTEGADLFSAIPGPNPPSAPWLDGLSWVYVKLTQPKRRHYTAVPRIEFEWRGMIVKAPRHRPLLERQITGTAWSNAEANLASPSATPESRAFGIKVRLHNDADPSLFDETRIWDGDAWVRLDSDTGDLPEGEWTSSAAAARYFFLTRLRGVPHTAIDRNSVVEADRICSERSYAVNGVIADDEDVNEIEDLFDFAWQGQVIDAGGVLLFRPGADRDPVLTLDVDDEAVSIDAVKPAPSLSERVNELTLTLDQSDAHQFRPMAMPPVVDRETQGRDGRRLAKDLGNIRFVTHAPTANRLMAIALKRARANTRFAYTLPPGDDYRWLTVRPTDRMRINDSENGLSAFLAEVLTLTVNEDWSVSIELQAAPDGIYDDDATFPPLIPLDIDIADPTDVAIPTGVTAAALIEKIADGTFIAGFTIGWGDTTTTSTDLRYRKVGDTQWIFLNSPASPIRVAPLPAGDYEFQLRHVSRQNIPSIWTDAATVTVAGDQIPPANPLNFAVSAIAGGYQATWTASPDTDYHHTEVYDTRTRTAFADATLRATIDGSSYSRHGLTTDTLDVWIRHIDTWGNASGEASATVTPSAQGQGRPGLDGTPGLSVAELIIFRKATLQEGIASLTGTTPVATPTATNYDFATGTFTGLTTEWSLQWPANYDQRLGFVFASTVTATAPAGGADTSLTFGGPRLVSSALNIDVIYTRAATPPSKPANQPADRNPADYPAPDTGWSTNPPTGDDPLYSCVRIIRGTQWVHGTPIPVGEDGRSAQEYFRATLLNSPPSTPTGWNAQDGAPTDWTTAAGIPRIRPAIPMPGNPLVLWRISRTWNEGTDQWNDFTPPVLFDGVPGADGAPGADSTVPGPIGPQGADSTVPGPMGRSAQEYFRITRLNDPPPKPTGRNAQDGSPPDWTTAAGLPLIRPVPIPGNPLVLWRISRTWNEGTDQWNDFTPPVLFDGVPGADGEGVPGGGTLGQVLTKIAAGDFQTGWQDTSGVSTQGPTGAQGAQGPQGGQGADSTVPGPQGPRGARGAKGDQGNPGARGAKGDQGNPGARGGKGDQGNPGAQGAKGDQGNPGAQGAKGDQGNPGAQGAKGDQGNPGARGTQGQRGFRGITGAAGAAGARGAQGAQGAQGPSHSHGTILSRLSSLENEVDDHDERINDLESA